MPTSVTAYRYRFPAVQKQLAVEESTFQTWTGNPRRKKEQRCSSRKQTQEGDSKRHEEVPSGDIGVFAQFEKQTLTIVRIMSMWQRGTNSVSAYRLKLFRRVESPNNIIFECMAMHTAGLSPTLQNNARQIWSLK